jgi:hypothetical protein
MKFTRLSILLSLCSFVILAALPVSAEEEKNESSEQATVILYRTRSAKGSAIRLNISGGDSGNIGSLSNGSKIIKKMPVGEFTFVATSPSIAGQDSVTINIEAGKTYYIEGKAKWGWPAARPGLTLMDEKKGKAEADKIEQ